VAIRPVLGTLAVRRWSPLRPPRTCAARQEPDPGRRRRDDEGGEGQPRRRAGRRRPGGSPTSRRPSSARRRRAFPARRGRRSHQPAGNPAIVVADGPAGLRIQPKREGDAARTYYCTAFPIETLLPRPGRRPRREGGRAMGNEVKEYPRALRSQRPRRGGSPTRTTPGSATATTPRRE